MKCGNHLSSELQQPPKLMIEMDKNLEKQLRKTMYEVLRADGPLNNSDYCKRVLDIINKPQEQIIEKIKNLPKYKNKGIELERRISERDFNRKLEELYTVKGRKVEWLKRRPEHWGYGKDAWYYCPGQEHLLRQRSGMILDEITYESRLHHTQDIKKEVINPWIEQLSSFRKNLGFPFVTYFNYLHPNRSYNFEENLPVEKNLLFLDFKNHIKTPLGDPIEKLESLKKLVNHFLYEEDETLNYIDSIIKIQLGIEIKKGHIPDWVKYLVYKILFDECEKNPNNIPILINPTYFKTQINFIENEYIIYSILPSIHEISLINKKIATIDKRNKIRKELEFIVPLNKFLGKPNKRFEENIHLEMDKKIMELPIIIYSISNVREKIISLIKIKEELIKTSEQIELSLKNYKLLDLYPGDCKYL